MALVISLYAFLGLALFWIWQDIRRQVEKSIPLDVQVSLVVRVNESEQRFTFNQTEIVIGRDPTNDCRLDDPTVSSQHARLSYHHHQWWVEDLKSTNGTFINAFPVTEPVVITNHDQLRCGQVTLEFIL
jgi:pSer/pThr/pTyr-binding forkhead associated (FHA) protein